MLDPSKIGANSTSIWDKQTEMYAQFQFLFELLYRSLSNRLVH